MGQLIQFEERAVARLRERLGEAEEANQDLIAFARGHSGAVASIHAAALCAIEAESAEDLLNVIACAWPAILGVDLAAAALLVGQQGFRADAGGVERVEPQFVTRMLASAAAVEVRSVQIGHPLFGRRAAASIRAEALICVDAQAPFPCGLIALGQTSALQIGSSHGSELLLFLGRIVASVLRRSVIRR